MQFICFVAFLLLKIIYSVMCKYILFCLIVSSSLIHHNILQYIIIIPHQ